MRQQVQDVLARMAQYEAGFTAQFAIPAEVGEYLRQFVIEYKVKNILELGTWRGASAIYLASALEELGQGLVTTVNLPHEATNIFQARENIEASGLSTFIKQVLQPAEDFLIEANNQKLQFDLIFIDADKGRVDKYVELGLNVLSQSGYIIVDDWKLLDNKQRQFFDQLKVTTNYNLRVVEIGNCLMVIHR